MPQRVYFSTVMHRRLGKAAYRFRYPVFSLLLDIDRLAETASASRLLRLERWGLLSFYPADHGPRDGSSLRRWAEHLLHGEGVELAGGRVLLLCFPRILGYVFNPLSLWYCFHRDGRLRAVIAEVRNTFGEAHCYVVHEHGCALDFPVRGGARKAFHVSPLIGMDCNYQFRFEAPGERLGVFIRQTQRDQLLLVASQTGVGRELSDRALLRALARTPLMTFKVVAAIHWQALKIWLRGARFHPKPEAPQEVN
ncbi:MAG: DUF1365 domain-containing protein [Gammaproteobacteria bacterium]